MKQILLGLIAAWERLWCLLLFRRKCVQYDKSIRFHGILAIYGRGTIRIGKNVRINSKTSANPAMGCYPKTVFNVTTGTLTIGDEVGMSGAARMVSSGMVMPSKMGGPGFVMASGSSGRMAGRSAGVGTPTMSTA